VADLIVRAKKEKPRRSIRRIIRMLERAGVVQRHELSSSSVHRLLKNAGISKRPLRGASDERRSFICEHAGDLWVGDALHGPLAVAPDRTVRKAYLISAIDDASRYVPHSQFFFSEGSVAHEYVLKQALLKHGRPRDYYVDLGSAYVADSLADICAALGIRLLHTAVRDPEAKGVIERWHRTWREEVGDELPDSPLPIAELNARHWAWLSSEYHARKHDTTQRAPREHWLADAHELRPLPRDVHLDEVFLHRETRTVRKDGTIRFNGQLLEVRSELSEREVQLRFDPNEPDKLPRVFVDGKFYCDTVLLDRIRNATRKRRQHAGAADPSVEPTGIDPLALIREEHGAQMRPVDFDRLSANHDDKED
jgi:transposase InsO family protein